MLDICFVCFFGTSTSLSHNSRTLFDGDKAVVKNVVVTIGCVNAPDALLFNIVMHPTVYQRYYGIAGQI